MSSVDRERELISKQRDEIAKEIIELLKTKTFKTDYYGREGERNISVGRSIDILEYAISIIESKNNSRDLKEL